MVGPFAKFHIVSTACVKLPSLISSWLLLILVLTGARGAWAQHFAFAYYGASSGLSNLNVATMLEDHSGIVWVGTESGVFTADGMRFEKLTAFSAAGLESVRAMREDSAHRIWAVDGRHLAFLQNGIVHSIGQVSLNVHSNETLSLEVLPSMPDTVYLLRAGELITISSTDGGGTWEVKPAMSHGLLAQYPKLANLLSLAPGKGTTLWAGCGQSLCRLDPTHQAVAVFGSEQGVPPDSWRSMLLTRKGVLWARGDHRLVLLGTLDTRFVQSAWQLPASEHLRSPMLVEDAEGRIVLNTDSGIARGDAATGQSYSPSNGLPEDDVDVLMFDHSGALWFSSLGHGLLRWYGYGNTEGWTRSEGLSNNVIWSINRGFGSDLWIATDKGLNRLEGEDTHPHVVPQPAVRQRTLSVVVDGRNHVWSADLIGRLTEFDPSSGWLRIAVNHLERIFNLHIDRKQRIWICSRKGLFFFSPDDHWAVAHPVHELPEGYAWAIAEGNDGTLWVSTGTGLYRLQGETWSAIKLPFPGGTAYNFTLAAAPDGTLWVQSKSPYPLLHLRINGRQASILSRVDSSQIGSDNITFVEIDGRGWIWVGSDDGVHVFDGTRWVRCTAEEGLIWDDTNFHAFYADRDGSVWIGTSAGLSHFLSPERLFTIKAPVVRVTDAEIADIKLKENATAALNLRTPTLTFRLLDTNYGRGSAIVMRYRLEGEENEWQDATGSQMRFPSLYPGHYKLQVLAYDRHLHLCSPIQQYTFIVLEPWWKRPCFLAVEAIASLGVLLGIWRLSVRLLVARQQELERLVAKRTEELEQEKKELLTARSELLETTRRDPLTGLLNRRAIFAHMHSLCSLAHTDGPSVAVIMADLDNFKRVNDVYGHLAGDAALQECAHRISSVTRPIDFVGRYGGEELLILMPGLDRSSVTKRIEEIRMAIAAEPVRYCDLLLNITCSFGVAWFSDGETTVEKLVALADSALYAAKRNGRNRVEYAPESHILESPMIAV